MTLQRLHSDQVRSTETRKHPPTRLNRASSHAKDSGFHIRVMHHINGVDGRRSLIVDSKPDSPHHGGSEGSTFAPNVTHVEVNTFRISCTANVCIHPQDPNRKGAQQMIGHSHPLLSSQSISTFTHNSTIHTMSKKATGNSEII